MADPEATGIGGHSRLPGPGGSGGSSWSSCLALPAVSVAVVDQFPVRALYGQVGFGVRGRRTGLKIL